MNMKDDKVQPRANWDESFHHTILRRLADMAIDLRLDVYPEPDKPEILQFPKANCRGPS